MPYHWVYGPSRRELFRHPSGLRHLFKSVPDFWSSDATDKIHGDRRPKSLGGWMKLIHDPDSATLCAPCLRHGTFCILLRAHIHVAGIPCVSWSPDGPSAWHRQTRRRVLPGTGSALRMLWEIQPDCDASGYWGSLLSLVGEGQKPWLRAGCKQEPVVWHLPLAGWGIGTMGIARQCHSIILPAALKRIGFPGNNQFQSELCLAQAMLHLPLNKNMFYKVSTRCDWNLFHVKPVFWLGGASVSMRMLMSARKSAHLLNSRGV